MGRPPAPLEHHRRVGRANGTKKADGRPLPVLAETVKLPAAKEVPPPPGNLRERGQSLWDQIWAPEITWISPVTDMQTAVEACRFADDVDKARARYRMTTEPADARALVTVSKSFMDALSALGFSPVARSRLGVAEVKRVSALEELYERRGRVAEAEVVNAG